MFEFFQLRGQTCAPEEELESRYQLLAVAMPRGRIAEGPNVYLLVREAWRVDYAGKLEAKISSLEIILRGPVLRWIP